MKLEHRQITNNDLSIIESESKHVTEKDLDRLEELYNVTDEVYQNACISYSYGTDINESGKMRETMSEADIANACDYAAARGLMTGDKQAYYQVLVDKRVKIAEKYNLSPIDAIVKRREIREDQLSADEEKDFADALVEIPDSENHLNY